jgi:hypothetical protein
MIRPFLYVKEMAWVFRAFHLSLQVSRHISFAITARHNHKVGTMYGLMHSRRVVFLYARGKVSLGESADFLTALGGKF